jgi:hypothetical protein
MEFKKLSAVEMVETVNDAAHVLIEENGVVKRAPKDEVGGIKVASAEVGQTIVVKAVDDNGVPTEWECADTPSFIFVEDGRIVSAPNSLYEKIDNMFNNHKPFFLTVYDAYETGRYCRHCLHLGKLGNGHFCIELYGGYCLDISQNGDLEYYDVD